MAEPEIKIPDPYRDPWDRFQKQFSWLFALVIGAMLIGFSTMLFMVAQLVIDAVRYRDASSQNAVELRQQTLLMQRMVELQLQANERPPAVNVAPVTPKKK